MVPVERTAHRQCAAPTIGAFLFGMKKKYFSKQQIEYYSQDPRVKYIDEYKLVLTYEFRLKLWEETLPNHSITDVRNALKNNNFIFGKIDCKWIKHLKQRFQKNKPSGGKNSEYHKPLGANTPDKSYDEYLLSTGKFIKGKKGISFTNEFVEEIHLAYPENSVEDYLKNLGFDVNRIGYQRIYNLKKLFEEPLVLEETFSDDVILSFKKNPYVKRITKKQFSLKDNFYNEAYSFKHLHINKILEIFEIKPSLLPISSKNRIKYKLYNWEKVIIDELTDNVDVLIKVEKNKYDIFLNEVNNVFNYIKSNIKRINCSVKKDLCVAVSKMDSTHDYCYSKRGILNKLGISKTNYYSILKNNNYGEAEKSKDLKDEKDIELIKYVKDYKGYPKGIKMIYMMLPRLTGEHMSIGKIRRLCKKYNISCGVRKSNSSRQQAQEMLDNYCQPNILKRQFKLFRPGEVTLSDVSYLKYRDNKTTAYFSAVKDGCSGKVSGVVEESQNLTLAHDTINLLGDNSNTLKMFHTDQGALYLNSSFQNKLKELGYTLSMSRRGNCWDNASMESFFGHTKDEIDYLNCSNLSEVKKIIDDYLYYYNYERPQWNRNKMTPVEYEKYINNMSNEEFKIIYDKELQRYKKMKEKAVEKAIKRAKDIGVE